MAARRWALRSKQQTAYEKLAWIRRPEAIVEVAEGFEGYWILAGQQEIRGTSSMPERIETDGGLAIFRPGAGAEELRRLLGLKARRFSDLEI
jgi:hypothetical protein